MSEPIKTLVVGCGSVGTMCALALHKSGACTVTAVLRSAYDLIINDGFHIESVDHGEFLNWKPQHVERTVADALRHGPFDYVLVALKNLPDVYSIADIVRPAVTPRRTSIVLVQNGLDIEQPVLDAFPQNPLLSGVAMIGSEQNGRHILHNDPDILYLGSFPNPNIPAAEQQTACSRFANMYNTGGAKCNIVDDIVWHRWRKLVWNASFNTVCALLNLDSGRVQDAGAVDTLIRPAMDEIVLLAAAAGYTLPSDIQDQMLAITPRELFFKPSMQQDAIKQRPMEVEVILGHPLRRTTQFGVETPTLTTLYRLLSAKQWSIRDGAYNTVTVHEIVEPRSTGIETNTFK